MKKLSILLVLISFLPILKSQESNPLKNVFDSLSEGDTITHAKVIIHQDKRIETAILERGKATTNNENQTNNPYKVQVFSSNAQKSAKTEAYKIEKELLQAFPNQAVVVAYIAPFWKVRIGNFKTLQEAQNFRTEVLKVFPDLRATTYTVKE